MTLNLTGFLDWFLAITRLQYWPVRVRAGVAAGARWTLYPWSSYWRGLQEPAVHAVLLALGDIRGWSCWDLGAHFGVYSVGLAVRVGPEGQVAAFEPNPLSYARLERHRRMNHLYWMRTFAAAVSDKPGTSELFTYGSLKSTSTHLAYHGETRSDAVKPITVSTLTLDSLVASGILRPPDFVKIDVEGHAHKALGGMRDALKAKRPILIVAFHSNQEVQGALELLQPLGYYCESIPTGSSSGASMIGRDILFKPAAT